MRQYFVRVREIFCNTVEKLWLNEPRMGKKVFPFFCWWNNNSRFYLSRNQQRQKVRWTARPHVPMSELASTQFRGTIKAQFDATVRLQSAHSLYFDFKTMCCPNNCPRYHKFAPKNSAYVYFTRSIFSYCTCV